MPMTLTPNAETALKLAGLGYFVFPCHSGGEKIKQPMPFVKWRDMSSNDPRQIRYWWSKWPDAAPGLDLAKSGLIVIDADRHGTADGVAAIAAMMDDHGYDCSAVPMVATPGNGKHFFYRQPEGRQFGNADSRQYKGRSLKAMGINIRGHGGYVIAPGAAMQGGRRYELIGDIGASPVLPGWFAAILEAAAPPAPARPAAPAAPVAPVAPAGPGRSDIGDRRIRAYCNAAIEDETAKVAGAPKGARNNTLNEAAFALGQLVGAGWIGEDEAHYLLMNAASQCGLGAAESSKTIQSGLGAGIKQPRSLPPSDFPDEVDPAEAARINAMILATWDKKERERAAICRAAARPDGGLTDAEIGAPVASAPPIADRGTIDFPDGLVGDIARWIVATARRPQPELAIGAALTIVGTVAGRQFSGPTRSGTHLYVLGLAPTGKGKDHPLQQISRIMAAARLTIHVGPSEFISMPSVVNFLMRKPLSVCPMDEFGGFMKRINSRRASSFESSISKVLRTMWSSSFAPYLTPEWASKPSETIFSPAMSIFGASTPEQFYAAMEGASLEDGTLNRFLLVTGRGDVAEVDPDADAERVPAAIVDGLRAIYFRSGELASALRNDPAADPITAGNIKRLAWGEGAQAAYKRFGTEIENTMRRAPDTAPFYARTVEMSLRIATITAIGRLAEEEVSKRDMDYGIALAGRSAKSMTADAADYMADNENQANAQKIMRAIKARGGDVKWRDLAQSLKNSIRPRDLRDIMAMMVEAGQIERYEVVNPRGSPTVGYRLG